MSIGQLDSPALLPQMTEVPITNLMYIIWLSRLDLQSAFDIKTESGQRNYLNWFRVSVFREYGLDPNMHLPTEAVDTDFTEPVIKHVHGGIAGSYPVLLRFENWLAHSARHLPPRLRTTGKRLWQEFLTWIARFQARAGARINFPLDKQATQLRDSTRGGSCVVKPGVNLVGYAYAELGMGEHVRMSAVAFGTTHVPHGIFNINLGVSQRKSAHLESGRVIGDNSYSVNLFHINADQMFRAFGHLGRNFFEGHYNIGYWAWELARCPNEWVPVFGFVDEIWAPSRFIQSAFAETASIPVQYMPLCVTLPKIGIRSRHEYGLPEDAYLFLFHFDINSYIHRKNPFAAIRAFKEAFPDRESKVGLVIKVMYASESDSNWKKMIEIVDDDDRVCIINKTMYREEVLGLLQVCDCYISLHRSEGFGRGPAEAMYLGKPVIVTNYSGNVDFTLPDNSCLVDYSLIPVLESQYPFSNRQVWADPDIEQAVWYMRKLVSEPTFGNSIGQKASVYIKDNFNPKRIGRLYEERLSNLDFF